MSMREHRPSKARYSDVIPFPRTSYYRRRRRRRICKDQTGTSGRHALIDRSEYRRDPRDGLRRQISEGHSYFLPAMKYDCSICSIEFIYIRGLRRWIHARFFPTKIPSNIFWKRLEYLFVLFFFYLFKIFLIGAHLKPRRRLDWI